MTALDTLNRAVVCCEDAGGLRAILAPEVALALWSPMPDPKAAELLAGLPLAEIDDVDLLLHVDSDPCGLIETLRGAGYPEAAAILVGEDCITLARRFAVIAGRDRLALRLQVIETDACRKFHANYVAWRLIKTYLGPATQWVHVDTPDAIESMATGDVGIFKGRLLHASPRVLHRSPPILATGERRLMLVIDPEDLSG